MPNKKFLNRVRGPLFREALGEELNRAKRLGDPILGVKHGIDDEVYAHITVGATPSQRRATCGRYELTRSNVRQTLQNFVREGHERFFDNPNLTENNRANSFFVLYRRRLCDLKAIARISLGLQPTNKLVQTPIVAQSLRDLGFTCIHFVKEPIENRMSINLIETEGQERDGLRYGRSGEGENHKRLRLWVKNNSTEVIPGLRGVQPKTEVSLDSGDRVDVVYYSGNKVVAIEVKSSDSDQNDLKRANISVRQVSSCFARTLSCKERKYCCFLITRYTT